MGVPRRFSGSAGVLLVGFVLLMTTLSGCSSNKAFEPVNQAVKDINPGALGKVVSDSRSGSGQALSQGPTRLVTVLFTGDEAKARSAATARMSSAGFEELGANGWRRNSSDGAVIISVTVIPTGQTPPGAGVVPAGQTGIFFNVSSGG